MGQISGHDLTGSSDQDLSHGWKLRCQPGLGPHINVQLGRYSLPNSQVTCRIVVRSRAPLTAQMAKNHPTAQKSLGREDPGRRTWQPAPVFLPGELCEHRSLSGYSPQGHREWGMTEWLTHFQVFLDWKTQFLTVGGSLWFFAMWISPTCQLYQS